MITEFVSGEIWDQLSSDTELWLEIEQALNGEIELDAAKSQEGYIIRLVLAFIEGVSDQVTADELRTRICDWLVSEPVAVPPESTEISVREIIHAWEQRRNLENTNYDGILISKCEFPTENADLFEDKFGLGFSIRAAWQDERMNDRE